MDKRITKSCGLISRSLFVIYFKIYYKPKGRVLTRCSTLLFLAFCFTGAIVARDLSVKTTYEHGDFSLVRSGFAAGILVSPEDFKVVRIAAGDLAADVEKITGIKPKVTGERGAGNVIIVGTLGKSRWIDILAARGEIEWRNLRGKWESYLIATVKKPFPGVEQALVIAGSDRRGTAYGVYELSQMIGVSPWIWWADVTPEKKKDVFISPGVRYSGGPSVKYRGIFLNDEDWGLQPWAAKTFEPETGDIGPKTYARIFELLLRLKANTLWPAMHEVTRPFNSIPGNAQMADDYAIVMGSSHAEPMLRNNVGEWKAPKEDYNFVTNPAGVTAYWEQRARENAQFENIYTLGMRGIHDSPVQGTKSQAERIPLLEKIFSVQRGLIGKYTDKHIENIPRIFCPYKEVLADYRAGLKVPDDVTIVFPDDNFGYIRQFPSAKEQKRKGGFGVYYHISYLGRPLSYLWLNTTPPALIWEEMSKAYDHGMRNLWIVNVGDIKPGEIGMEFFLQMAWDIKKWRRDNLPDYLGSWAAREFGPTHASEIAGIMDAYYRLGFARKPEHLQWYLPNEAPKPSNLTDNEKLERVAKYSEISRRANSVSAGLPLHKKDAFYELVLYPVQAAALANVRFFAAEFANRQGAGDSGVWAKRYLAADNSLDIENSYFNETLAGGKWRGMLAPEMNPGQWPSMRSTPPTIAGSILREADTPNGMLLRFGPQTFQSFAQTRRRVFEESGGIVSLEAESFTRKLDRGETGWQIIPGLGRTGDSVAVFPTTSASIKAGAAAAAPALEYDISSLTGGEYSATFYLVPTHPLVPDRGLRFAVGMDDQPPQLVTAGLDAEVSSPKWAQNVLNATVIGSAKLDIGPGKHTLKIYMVDAGVVLDKIVLSKGGAALGYLGPPETLVPNREPR
jgi:Glycosyl hydrolase family 115/Gylcosyl hydrolase family 115 C-terminal domain